MDENHAAMLASFIQGEIDRALDTLFGDLPAKPVSRMAAEHVMQGAAQHIATYAADMALSSLLTTEDVAAIFRVSVRRVRELAKSRSVGWQVSRGTWIFRPTDLPALKPRPTAGRPKKERDQS